MRIYSLGTPFQPVEGRVAYVHQDLIRDAGHEINFEATQDTSPELREQALQASDGLVVEFTQPDPELEAHITRAHLLGKGVLVFMPRFIDPDILLPTFAPHPRKAEDRNRPLHAYWLNQTDEIGNEIAIHSGGMREMKLRIWIASQAMRLGESRPEMDEEFQVELANNKRFGSEADQPPLFEN